jgi:hypothetical protein
VVVLAAPPRVLAHPLRSPCRGLRPTQPNLPQTTNYYFFHTVSPTTATICSTVRGLIVQCLLRFIGPNRTGRRPSIQPEAAFPPSISRSALAGNPSDAPAVPAPLPCCNYHHDLTGFYTQQHLISQNFCCHFRSRSFASVSSQLTWAPSTNTNLNQVPSIIGGGGSVLH